MTLCAIAYYVKTPYYPVMPTIYVDAAFREVVREEVRRLKRERGDSKGPDEYVPERDGLECLLTEDAKRRVKRKREQRNP